MKILQAIWEFIKAAVSKIVTFYAANPRTLSFSVGFIVGFLVRCWL